MVYLVFLLCLGGEVCDFEPGEFIVLKFDGAASYSYQLKTGETRNYSVEKEDTLFLENKEILETEQTMNTHVRISQDGIQIFLGLDKDLKMDDVNTAFNEQMVDKYSNAAIIHNKIKNDGPLSHTVPINISGNFIGIETHRKDFTCIDNGNEINADQKVPYKDCFSTGDKKYNGKMVVTQYSKEQLIAKMAGSQNTMAIGKVQIPLELIVKNVGSTATEDSKLPAPGSQPSEGKSGCALSFRRDGSVSSLWAIFVTLLFI